MVVLMRAGGLWVVVHCFCGGGSNARGLLDLLCE